MSKSKSFAKWQGHCSTLDTQPIAVRISEAFPRADVRIRIRGGVIRIRVNEACIRSVIRITTEANTTQGATNLYHILCYLSLIMYIKRWRRPEGSLAPRFSFFCLLILRMEAEPRAEVRIRIRGGVIRIRENEARTRSVIRRTTEANTTPQVPSLRTRLSRIDSR